MRILLKVVPRHLRRAGNTRHRDAFDGCLEEFMHRHERSTLVHARERAWILLFFPSVFRVFHDVFRGRFRCRRVSLLGQRFIILAQKHGPKLYLLPNLIVFGFAELFRAIGAPLFVPILQTQLKISRHGFLPARAVKPTTRGFIQFSTSSVPQSLVAALLDAKNVVFAYAGEFHERIAYVHASHIIRLAHAFAHHEDVVLAHPLHARRDLADRLQHGRPSKGFHRARVLIPPITPNLGTLRRLFVRLRSRIRRYSARPRRRARRSSAFRRDLSRHHEHQRVARHP